MDTRRALIATAVVAVLAPVALAASPVVLSTASGVPAHGVEGGDGSPSPTTTASASPFASPTATPSASAPGASGPASPTATASPTAPAPTPTAPTATVTPSPTGPPRPDPSPSPTDVPATPSVRPTGSPSASPGESPDQDSPNGVCDVADFDVHVSGLPATVPAGTTTEPFTVVLDNTAGEDATHVQFGLSVAFREGRKDADWLAAQKYVSVRYYDWDDARWQDASTGGGVYTYADIEAGHRYEMRLRLVLAPGAPPGTAGALAFSTWWDFGRESSTSGCVYDNEWYRFEITAPDRRPRAAEVRPQGGRAPSVLQPATQPERTGATRLDGALARTGPASHLPVTALASVLAGALGLAALLFGRRARRRA